MIRALAVNYISAYAAWQLGSDASAIYAAHGFFAGVLFIFGCMLGCRVFGFWINGV